VESPCSSAAVQSRQVYIPYSFAQIFFILYLLYFVFFFLFDLVVLRKFQSLSSNGPCFFLANVIFLFHNFFLYNGSTGGLKQIMSTIGFKIYCTISWTIIWSYSIGFWIIFERLWKCYRYYTSCLDSQSINLLYDINSTLVPKLFILFTSIIQNRYY